MITKYTDFWKEFELIHEFIYLSINHNAADQGLQAMNNIIRKHKIKCGIKINIQTGFRNNLPCPERNEQNEMVLSMDFKNEDEPETLDVDQVSNIKQKNKIITCIEHVIESMYNEFHKLFSDKHPVKDWWHVIKYTPRFHTESAKTFELVFNYAQPTNDKKNNKFDTSNCIVDETFNNVTIKSNDFTFHPIANNDGRMNIIIFVDDTKGKDRYLLKEDTDKHNNQIFRGHQYIQTMIVNVIGEYMYRTYLDMTEFYPNMLYEKIPRIPLYKLYDVMVDELNLSYLFTICQRCLISNYQQYLITKTIKGKRQWFCDDVCYEAFIEKNESLYDISYM